MRIFLLLIFISGFAIPGNSQTIQTVNNITQGCAPLSIQFSWSAGSASYYWDFKDGTTSNLNTPSNTFNKAGIYNITFQASPTGPVLGTKQIEVFATPVLSVTSTSGCAPVNTTLTGKAVLNSAISISNYSWVFGDLTGASGPSASIVHTYSAAGKYDVSLAIQTNFPSCNVTQILPQAVNLTTAPVASFTTSPSNTVTCEDSLDVTFANTTSVTQAATYAWNLGNGRTSTARTPNPAVQRYFSGSYTASLKVSYKGLAGCTTSTSKTITVGRPPVAIKAKKDTICIYQQAVIKTLSPPPGTYLWDIGLNATAPDLNKDSVIISFSTPGLHTVSLSLTTPDGQCTDVRTADIFVQEVIASIAPSDTFSCRSGHCGCSSPAGAIINYKATANQSNVSYDWDIYRLGGVHDTTHKNLTSFDYEFFSELDTIYYSKNGVETFKVDLTVTSQITGCSTKTSSNMNLWVPNAQFKTDLTKGCAPLTVTMIDSSSIDNFAWSNDIVSWEWIFDDGQKDTNYNKAPFQHTYTSPGKYYPRLVITTAQGCTDTSYAILIEVGTTLNTVDFSSDKISVCPGEAMTLSVVNPSPLVSAYHFITDGNKVFHCANDQSVSWSYDDTVGTQDVSLMMDYNGCYTTITKNNYITVNGSVAKIDYFALCSSPMDYHFTSKSQGATSLTWTFGTQTSSASTVAHTYAATGDSIVTLTTQGAGCADDIDMVVVNVRKVEAKIIRDSLLCLNSSYTFDASTSVDAINSNCHSGYTWQFPDIDRRPYTTDQPLATFAFAQNGVHTIRLIVKDDNGCRDTATAEFKVFNITVNAPTVSKTDICTPTTVYLQDNSVGDTTLVSWNWHFGDGAADSISTVQSLFPHTFKNPPSSSSFYDVSWIVTDALGCKTAPPLTSIPHTVINYYKPVSNINATPRFNLCLGDSVQLSAPDFTSKGSYLTFAWDLGTQGTSTQGTNPFFKYPVGNNPIKLIYTEFATGCKDSTTANVFVQNYPDVKMWTSVDATPEICAPKQVKLSDTLTVSTYPITSRLWNIGNGQPLSSDTIIFTTYPSKGTYNISLIEQTSNGCADTAQKTITLYKPEGNFTMNKDQICRYDAIDFTLKDTVDVTSWTWSFGDGVNISNQNPISHPYDFHPPGGTTLAKLTLYKGTCPNNPPIEHPVTIYQLISDFTRLNGTDSSICFTSGDIYHFDNISSGGYTTWGWDFGDNTTSSDFNPDHKYLVPGNYDVTLAIANATCKDTIRKTAYVYPNPVVLGIGDTVCDGNTLQLHVANPNAASTYTWSPSTGLSNINDLNPTANIPSTLTYTLTETTQDGCVDSTSVTGIVIEPDWMHDWDTTIVIGDYATLPAHGRPVYSFLWTPTDSLSCLNCDYPKTNPLSDITYTVQVSDVRNCYNPSYLYTVKVHPETFIKMPTAFSPNGDGNNDILYVTGWGIKELKSFQIFNRWGQLIYSSSDITEGWNGKYKGSFQNEDVYVYKITGIDWRDKELHLEGYVNLLH